MTAVAARERVEPVDVAVGVLFDREGRFLLAQRPAGKPMAGYWEFPGGKVEASESVFEALVREFDEELGLTIATAHPWARRVVVYPHATVRLHFCRSFGAIGGWSGTPEAREGQAFRWQRIDALDAGPWLPGAKPVERWMRLWPVTAIAGPPEESDRALVARLERALSNGTVRQVVLRRPGADGTRFERLFDVVRALTDAHGARLVVSSRHPSRFWSRADGVHLTSRDLMRSRERPDTAWCLASCHDAHELAHAASLGVDAAVLGPVLPTASHPGAPGLGWSGFAVLARAAAIPVYAIGGLGMSDARDALDAGAHGLAMQRRWG